MNCGANMKPESLSTQTGAVVVIDLDLISATTDAVTLAPKFGKWAKAPDVYAVVLQRTAAATTSLPPPLSLDAVGDVLKLIWWLDCFPKPLISLLGALLTPLDIAMSTFGTHRVASPDYRFSIPPVYSLTGVPAAGVAYALARLPGTLGADLALTAREIGPADALAAGLVTHRITATEFPRILAMLADGQPVDPLLDGLHVEPARSAKQIESGARAIAGDDADAIADLIARAKTMDVRESLIASYRLAAAFRGQRETSHAKLDISRPSESGDLQLPSRANIESGRF